MSNRYRKFQFHIVLLLILIMSHSTVLAADWPGIIDKVGPAIGKIQVKNENGRIISQGSGFVLLKENGSEILVTNAHVVRDAHYNNSFTIEIEFLYSQSHKEEVYTGTIESIDSLLDLCTINMDKKAPANLKTKNGEKTPLMSEIVAMGYPLGKDFKVTPGFVQAYQDVDEMGDMLDLSSILAPGNSGGPIINTEGFVIGIATASIRAYNFNLALPIENLNFLLQNKSEQKELFIESIPSNVRVFLDTIYKGETPLTLDLYNKEYDLVLEKDNFDRYEEKIGPWNLDKKHNYFKQMEIKANLDPEITINSIPVGAEVYVNNRYLGLSPVSVKMESGRIMRIRLKKFWYKEYTETYNVNDEAEQIINIDMNK